MESANYNSLFRMTGLKRHFWGTIVALLLANTAFASDWTAPATEFAKSISGVTGSGAITITVTNSSSLANSDVAEIQKAIEAQLRAAGVRIGSAPNVTSDVHVTLSENLQGYLWVAEITKGGQTQVTMLAVPRTEAPVLPQNGPSVTIRKTLLWSQPTQILDVWPGDKQLVVLDSHAVSVYANKSGTWQLDHSMQIWRNHPFPRDLRGILAPGSDRAMLAYLPGTVCQITTGSNGTMTCHDGDDPWPIGPKSALFNSSRNYFTETLGTYKSGGPFYSAVWVSRPGSDVLVTTGVDGRVHIDDGANQRTLPTSMTADWGSAIAAVTSKCGSGTQILVTSAGDDTMTDSLRAFEMSDHDPVQVSAPADFPGPITALWSRGDTAIAITRNLQTGSYDAYNVSVTCNQ
jgi:hypothetical protein